MVGTGDELIAQLHSTPQLKTTALRYHSGTTQQNAAPKPCDNREARLT